MTDRMTMNDRMDDVFNRRHAPRGLDDSARNQLAELAHEACEDHCPDCGACFFEDDELTECDRCGWDDFATVEPDHDPWRCDCDTCGEDRAEARATLRGGA